MHDLKSTAELKSFIAGVERKRCGRRPGARMSVAFRGCLGAGPIYHIIYPTSLAAQTISNRNSALLVGNLLASRVGIKLHGVTFHSSMTRLFPASAMNEALLFNY
jgi:hypothetical protein